MPERVNRKPEQENGHADERIFRIAIDGIGDHQPTSGDEHSGGERMTGNAISGCLLWLQTTLAATKDEKTGGGQSEEQEIHGDHVIENLLIASGDGDDHGPSALQNDGHYRHASARADVSHGGEEQFVIGHGEVHAWGGENRLAEKTEGGDGDAEGDPGGAGLP